MFYLFKLIERDGLLIGKDIYSKSYGTKIICGHCLYIYKSKKITNPKEKDDIMEELYGLYSDQGEEIDNVHTCKNCSQRLGIINFDDFDGATDGAGNLIESRTVLNENDIFDKTDKEYVIDYSSKYYKEKLVSKGITSLQNINKLKKYQNQFQTFLEILVLIYLRI